MTSETSVVLREQARTTQLPSTPEIWIRKCEVKGQATRWLVQINSETLWDFPENESQQAYNLALRLGELFQLNTYDESSEFSAELMRTSLTPEGFPEKRKSATPTEVSNAD